MSALRAELRFWGVVAVIAFLGFTWMTRAFPTPQPIHVVGKGQVSVVSSPKPAEVNLQAAVSADQAVASLSATQKAYTNLLNSYESLLAKGLQPRYVPKLTVQAKLVAASPAPLPSPPAGWTKAQTQALYDTDRSALASVINDPSTKLNLNATLTQVEAPQARFGTMLTSHGSGVAYDAVRKGQYDLEIGGIVHASHVVPALSLQYSVPHTSISAGPVFVFDKRLTAGIAATVRITH